MNLDDFCSNEVPDFTPLGGNRPDCAVVMSVAVSLVDNQQHQPSPSLLLSPDVLDTAMAAVCATVIIRSASDVVPPPHGSDAGGLLSCKLKVKAEASLDEFCFPRRVFKYICDDSEWEKKRLPWRYYDNVTLKIVILNSITSYRKKGFLAWCDRLTTLDLRDSTLQTMGDCCLYSCAHLRQVYLPDTLHTVGESFLRSCDSLIYIDLRHTKLHTLGDFFMYGCVKLAEVHLPETLHTVGVCFLEACRSLISIDLRHTKLHTASTDFMSNQCKLTGLQLPETLHIVGDNFLRSCDSLASIDLRDTNLHTAGHSFLRDCESLTDVRLPNTFRTVEHLFLRGSSSLVSIDLRNTKLHTLGEDSLSECENLRKVHLPDTIDSVGCGFLSHSYKIPQKEVESMKDRGSSAKRSRNN